MHPVSVGNKEIIYKKYLNMIISKSFGTTEQDSVTSMICNITNGCLKIMIVLIQKLLNSFE